MLKRVLQLQSLRRVPLFHFSNQRKPPKGFQKFERPLLEEEQRKQWKTTEVEKYDSELDEDHKPEFDKFKTFDQKDKQKNKEQEKKESEHGQKLLTFATALLGWYYLKDKIFPSETQININQFQNQILPTTKEITIRQSNQSQAIYAHIVSDKGSFRLKIGNPDTFLENLEKHQLSLNIAPENMIKVYFSQQSKRESLLDVFSDALPLILIVCVGYVGFKTMSQVRGMGGKGMFGLFKSNHKEYTFEQKVKIKFQDVAGLDEAKVEIKEFVEFLKNSKKFTNLGAKIPRGALLTGPPGTGKTMMAKACAGESGVPFFYVSGSEFVEMYVGLGAARVRDLFKQAKEKSPSIIFIDEIDAVGKKRDARVGNDEAENTLNQLLVEMDGFGTNENVIVLAATNMADALDSALTRPGRLDRFIEITLPDITGRKQIFLVHLAPLTLDPKQTIEEYANRLATLTPGFSGAEIANLCNEAAILAARQSKKYVDSLDFEMAAERVMAGLEKKSILSKEERKTVAYHESGHATVSWFLEGGDPLLKLTIIPRSKGSLGYAQYLPNESSLLTKQEILDKICCILGGRCSEKHFFKKITTGAYDDLSKAKKLAYNLVTKFGMSERIGYQGFGDDARATYSKKTEKVIDDEVRQIIQECTERTERMIQQYSEQIESLSELLLEKETLDLNQLISVLGERPFPPKSNFKAFLVTKQAEKATS